MAREKFMERWVKSLMDSMDAHLDEQTKISVMESCGRTCAREGAIRSAQECQRDSVPGPGQTCVRTY